MTQPVILHNKIFRAEKTTRNRDDFRVLLVGSLVTIAMMLVVPLISQFHDYALADRPFVTATVEVVESDQYERPMLLYDADAKQPTDATWIAIIRDADGIRLSTRRGQGSYEVKKDEPRLWTWAAFFDTETGSPLPEVPNQPFQVCLRYVSIAQDSGVHDETPEDCSSIFYPSHLTTSETTIKEYVP